MTQSRHDDRRPDGIFHAAPEHRDVVLIDWMLGNSCNHACSYCPPNLHDGSIRWQEASDVIGFFDRLARHYVHGLGRHVWLQFTGGEPTMHPGIVPILTEAAARGFRTSLISNGSRTFRFWERILGLLDSAILTYHDEFADHAHFLDVVALLAREMPVHVNVTVHPDRFDTILDLAAEIEEAAPRVSMAFKPLRVGFGTELYGYTPAQVDRLEGQEIGRGKRDGSTPRGVMLSLYGDGAWELTRANDFILRGRNRWAGYQCDAGLESLRIHADGRIFRAVCGAGGVLGRLGRPVELPLSPVLCDRQACGCVSDILITKRRPDALEAAAGLAS